ncbi:hypothetical protein FFWV33_14270 [Flavobacterium faecale]|uniref:DUF2158 domain-containing protein n=1 Tax=Flavobacterium faecale TaxID=1355330 RepID=A0A2S1LFX7_9FLAO|nr:hypothetical protein [Flavobacterium faecale]AWG22608.1 hypothetical protein FFWV33_14270 [Flavobacterium faecale]
MVKLGQNVQVEEGEQIMKVIDIEPGAGENVITQWQDELGNTLIGEFIESDLIIIESSQTSN